MASTNHTNLEAASSERKARLAKLASLKRKQPDAGTADEDEPSQNRGSKTDVYISGRNYDISTRGPKLGFENSPAAGVNTLEGQARTISTTIEQQASKDEAEAVEKGIDLFKLQPKKPNWDLKRDLTEKMKILDVRTQNAMAKLVRERIERAKKDALDKQKSNVRGGAGTEGEGEEEQQEIGIGGNELVEGVHLREKEEEEARIDGDSDVEDEVT